VGDFTEKIKRWWGKKSNTDKIVIALCLVAIVGLGAKTYTDKQSQSTPEIALSQAVRLSQNVTFSKAVIVSDSSFSPPANVITFTVSANETKAVDVKGKETTLVKDQKVIVNAGSMNIKELSDIGLKMPAEYVQTSKAYDWGKLANDMLFPVLMIALLWFMMSGGIASGGYDKFKKENNNVRFSDIGGISEVKDDLKDVVNFLRNRDYFDRVGARVPKGILLAGPPGTGKTLLARALATEASVPFYYTTGAEFHTMWVGMAGMRIKKLFKKARKTASIIFIDEFESIAHARSAGGSDAGREWNHTLTQLLSEMDGFKPTDRVLVIASTNRPEVLDPAALRSGRFDLRINVGLPNYQERCQILKIHTRDKPLSQDVSIESLAKQTGGLSGADLANIVNEAAVIAGRKRSYEISMGNLVSAIDKVLVGSARKNVVISDKERKVLAYHEAGHAVVSSLIEDGETVQHISILPHGSAGGFTRMSNENETVLLSKAKAMSTIAVLLAGRTAEEIAIGDITSGAQSDLQRANALAFEMVAHFGMSSEYGLRYRSPIEVKDSGDDLINREVNTILNECHESAKKILSGNNDKLVKVADKLLETESLDGQELEALL